MIRDIFNTYRHAIRLHLKHYTRPKTIEEAEEKRLFWAKCYAISAFFAFISATYITAKDNLNFNYRTDIPSEQAKIDKLCKTPTKVYKFHNFTKVDEFVYVPISAQNNKKPDPESSAVETSEVSNEVQL